jgi:hypothetical protein
MVPPVGPPPRVDGAWLTANLEVCDRVAFDQRAVIVIEGAQIGRLNAGTRNAIRRVILYMSPWGQSYNPSDRVRGPRNASSL